VGRTRERLAIAVKFGDRMRERRKELGYSQERLAQIVDLHMTYVSSVERGERNVSLVNIARIAEALDCDPAYLVEGLRA
jgi:transcriptional regulator with XRE-family HTH domain